MATDYNQLLCEKMQKEFDNLIEKFKSKEPAEILKHTYELDRLYNDWLKSDVNYMDMVRDSIDSSVNRAVKEMKARQKESR